HRLVVLYQATVGDWHAGLLPAYIMIVVPGRHVVALVCHPSVVPGIAVRRNRGADGDGDAGQTMAARLQAQVVEGAVHVGRAAEDAAHVPGAENDEERLAPDAHVVGLPEVAQPGLHEPWPVLGAGDERGLVDEHDAELEAPARGRGEVETQPVVEPAVGRIRGAGQVVPVEGKEREPGVGRLVNGLVDLVLRVIVPANERLVAAQRARGEQGAEVVVLAVRPAAEVVGADLVAARRWIVQAVPRGGAGGRWRGVGRGDRDADGRDVRGDSRHPWWAGGGCH